MKQWAKQIGFTVVELMVVIIAIGILASITIVAYNGHQERAANAKIRVDMDMMRSYLESYYGNYGKYPTTNGSWSYSSNSPDTFIPLVAAEYGGSLPHLTKGTVAGNNCYVYKSNGDDYKLIRLGQPSLSAAEQASIPSSMKDQFNGSDRYGYWSPGGSGF